MDHSSITYLMGPDGKFIRHFPFGTSADDIKESPGRDHKQLKSLKT